MIKLDEKLTKTLTRMRDLNRVLEDPSFDDTAVDLAEYQCLSRYAMEELNELIEAVNEAGLFTIGIGTSLFETEDITERNSSFCISVSRLINTEPNDE